MKWQNFELNIPDIVSAKDDEIEALFPMLDGRWSSLSRWLIKTHEATGLDLNQNWANVPQDWICPCCSRSKFELARKRSDGVLLAHLHEHHDHIHDYMAARLQETYGKEWPRGIPVGTYELEHLGSIMIERFQRTLVCDACNEADGNAKVGSSRIETYFSFRPSEIKEFITISPNQSHRVDVNEAEAIWETGKKDFLERIELADHLINHIYRGAITRERTRGVPAWAQSYDALSALLTRKVPSMVESITAMQEALLARSISRDGVGTARPRSKKPGVRPTQEDVVAHDGGGYSGNWQRAPVDWRCAACGRDRMDLLRRSKKQGRRWSGEIRHHVTYLHGPSPSLDLAQSVVVTHEVRLICDCCDTLLSWLRSRERGAAPKALALSIDQIRRCVDAGPNRMHVIDIDALRVEALQAEKFATAIQAYQASVAQATSPRRTYKYFLERKPSDWAYAWREVVSRNRKIAEGETVSAAEIRVRRLIEKADLLVPLDSGRTPIPRGSEKPSVDDLTAFLADQTPTLSWH